MKKHTSHVEALKYLRKEHLGRKLSYREMAEVLSANCGETIPKSEPWNAEHRQYKCPKRVKVALINMGLLDSGRRYRFFYELDEESYKQLKRWLSNQDITFAEYINALIDNQDRSMWPE